MQLGSVVYLKTRHGEGGREQTFKWQVVRMCDGRAARPASWCFPVANLFLFPVTKVMVFLARTPLSTCSSSSAPAPPSSLKQGGRSSARGYDSCAPRLRTDMLAMPQAMAAASSKSAEAAIEFVDAMSQVENAHEAANKASRQGRQSDGCN